jgi:hypothetical protein
LKAVVAQFNASMTRCPIVLDDECHALKEGLVSSYPSVTTPAFTSAISTVTARSPWNGGELVVWSSELGPPDEEVFHCALVPNGDGMEWELFLD